MPGVKQLPAKIEAVKAYSEELKVFRLRLHGSSDFSFVPGQFVMLSLPGLVDNSGKSIAKAYSIASSPGEKGIIELCVVNNPNGALSTPLFKLKVGDEVAVTGPYGTFQLKKLIPKGTVFIAGGTGIAPLMSLLRLLYSEGYNEKLWLFYSVSEPKLFLFKEELIGYSRNNNLHLVVSTSKPDSEWHWEHGRITATLPKKVELMSDIPKESRQFYLCGSSEMVSDTVKMLLELGFRKENMHKEQW